MSVYDIFAQQIQRFEGWSLGSRSYRNNNPGNIRPGNLSLGQTSIDSGGFGVFPSYQAGYNALINDIIAKFTGHTHTGLGPGSTVVDFFAVYNPVSDGGQPTVYAQSVVDGINQQTGAGLSIYNTLADVAAVDSGVIPDTATGDGSTDNSGAIPLDGSSDTLTTVIAALLLLLVSSKR